MAPIWTSPRSWTAGELITKAIMDQHIRDNLEFLRQFPAARVYNTANISLPNAATTTLTFNTETFKTVAAMHSTASNTSRLVAPIAGIYTIKANVAIIAADLTLVMAQILHNGATILDKVQRPSFGVATGHADLLVLAADYVMAANDYVEVQARQERGSTQTAQANTPYTPSFSLVYLGPTTNE